jgi:hypothetical protein
MHLPFKIYNVILNLYLIQISEFRFVERAVCVLIILFPSTGVVTAVTFVQVHAVLQQQE